MHQIEFHIIKVGVLLEKASLQLYIYTVLWMFPKSIVVFLFYKKEN